MRARLVRDYRGPTREGPTEYYAICDYAGSVSDCTLCSASPATGDCGPLGGAGEELLGATLFGTAGRRPNRGCGLRAAADAALHNVTKPHRPRTYWDAGRERASGAAGRSKHLKAPLVVDSDGVVSLKWTWGGVRSRSDHADVGHGGDNRFLSIVTAGQRVRIIDSNSPSLLAL